MVVRRGRFQFGRFVTRVKTAGGAIANNWLKDAKPADRTVSFLTRLHMDEGCSEFLRNFVADDRRQANVAPFSGRMQTGHASFVSISGRMNTGHASLVSISGRVRERVSSPFRDGCKLATRNASQFREDATWPREFRLTFVTDGTWPREFHFNFGDRRRNDFRFNFGTGAATSFVSISRRMQPGHASFVSISGRMQP